MSRKYGDTSGLFRGAKVSITIGDVTATATFIAGIQGTAAEKLYMVELDGTGQLIQVPGYTISKTA